MPPPMPARAGCLGGMDGPKTQGTPRAALGCRPEGQREVQAEARGGVQQQLRGGVEGRAVEGGGEGASVCGWMGRRKQGKVGQSTRCVSSVASRSRRHPLAAGPLFPRLAPLLLTLLLLTHPCPLHAKSFRGRLQSFLQLATGALQGLTGAGAGLLGPGLSIRGGGFSLGQGYTDSSSSSNSNSSSNNNSTTSSGNNSSYSANSTYSGNSSYSDNSTYSDNSSSSSDSQGGGEDLYYTSADYADEQLVDFTLAPAPAARVLLAPTGAQGPMSLLPAQAEGPVSLAPAQAQGPVSHGPSGEGGYTGGYDKATWFGSSAAAAGPEGGSGAVLQAPSPWASTGVSVPEGPLTPSAPVAPAAPLAPSAPAAPIAPSPDSGTPLLTAPPLASAPVQAPAPGPQAGMTLEWFQELLAKLNGSQSWEALAALCSPLPGVACDDMGQVVSLNFDGFGLAGTVPEEITYLANLKTLILSNNRLIGPVPRFMSTLASLQVLRMDNNALTSLVPHSLLSDMPALRELSLAGNRLRGPLPDFSPLSVLTLLDASRNAFSGALPDELGGLPSLQVLSLFRNQLSGQLTDVFANLSSLLALDLSSNFLVGTVPASLAALPALVYLDLSDNQLSGPAPTAFASAAMGGPNAVYAVGRNYFTGRVAVTTAAGGRFCPQDQHPQPEGLPVLARLGDRLSTAQYGTQQLNCLRSPRKGAAAGVPGRCPWEQQRSWFECVGFCGAVLPEGPCAGVGTCLLAGSSFVPTCSCDDTFQPGMAYVDSPTGPVPYPTCVPAGATTTGPAPAPAPSSANAGLHTTGLVLDSGPDPFLNRYFRYASVGFTGTKANPSWNYSRAVDWSTTGYVADPEDQGGCAACWAISAVEAVGSAVAIVTGDLFAVQPGPSVQEVLDCNGRGLSCLSGGWPGDALRAMIQKRSLADSIAYPFQPSLLDAPGRCKKQMGTLAGPVMYEQIIHFYNWLGLALAVGSQPVIVNVAASAESFRTYSGGFVYNDPLCFASGSVDHNLLLVGYNLDAPVPYWLFLNSWGSDWGEGGYMRMAIYPFPDKTGRITDTGAGVCGIYSSPALYPVIRGSDPCGPINPCGQGTCSAVNGTNLCKCSRGFVSVTNIDGSQSCSPQNICAFFPTNPCRVGSCANDKRGSYSCVCPLGFTSGVSSLGGATCVPTSTSTAGTLTVGKGSTSCYMVAVNWGLRISELEGQNPGLNCSRFIPPGTVLSVVAAAPCSLPYAISPVDSCDSVDALFRLNGALQDLNPALNCSNLFPGLQVCVDRSNGPYQYPLCTSIYSAAAGDSCQSIMQHVAKPPLTPFEFFSMNPGLMCNNLQPAATADSPLGTQVCLQSSPLTLGSIRCKYHSYRVSRGDSCVKLYSRYYKRASNFKLYNQFACTDSWLWWGRVLCLPKGKKPRY